MINAVDNIANINNPKNIFNVSNGVTDAFSQSIFDTVDALGKYSDKTAEALNSVKNIIILEDKNSDISDNFQATEEKFHKHAQDAYGFVSKEDNAIVIVQDNHQRKDVSLEGSIEQQGADTFNHEIGHIIDKELSTTDEFKKAYLADLKVIEEMLEDENAQINGRDLRETLHYLKHYVDGVNFEDGISEEDITRTGLRENFAECFSTIVDENPSEINEIYSTLFKNTMAQTQALIV